MKSVTIRNNDSEILVKIIHRKNGAYDLIRRLGLAALDIEVRDDKGYKVIFMNSKQEVSQSQGKKNDSGKLRFELLPPEAVEQIVHVLTQGAQKYADRNWEAGLSYGRVYGALQRHLSEFWKGNDIDPEWGAHHLAHAGCCLLFFLTYEMRGMKKWDDRLLNQETRPNA